MMAEQGVLEHKMCRTKHDEMIPKASKTLDSFLFLPFWPSKTDGYPSCSGCSEVFFSLPLILFSVEGFEAIYSVLGVKFQHGANIFMDRNTTFLPIRKTLNPIKQLYFGISEQFISTFYFRLVTVCGLLPDSSFWSNVEEGMCKIKLCTSCGFCVLLCATWMTHIPFVQISAVSHKFHANECNLEREKRIVGNKGPDPLSGSFLWRGRSQKTPFLVFWSSSCLFLLRISQVRLSCPAKFQKHHQQQRPLDLLH